MPSIATNNCHIRLIVAIRGDKRRPRRCELGERGNYGHVSTLPCAESSCSWKFNNLEILMSQFPTDLCVNAHCMTPFFPEKLHLIIQLHQIIPTITVHGKLWQRQARQCWLAQRSKLFRFCRSRQNLLFCIFHPRFWHFARNRPIPRGSALLAYNSSSSIRPSGQSIGLLQKKHSFGGAGGEWLVLR